MSSPVLTVRTITPEQHLDHLRRLTAEGGSASFLQTPAWGEVKSEWKRESIGWFGPVGTQPVGVGLVLYRAVSNRDYPLMQALFLIITVTTLVTVYLVDMIYVRLDPRVRR